MNKKPSIPHSRSDAMATSLPTGVAHRVDRFLEDEDLACLYKCYEWKSDKWAENDGFACIFKMESDFRIKLRGKCRLSVGDYRRIAFWGGHRKSCSVSVKEAPDLSKLRRRTDISALVDTYKCVLKGVKQFGPTYASKALRFLSPQRCGVIDTHLVREFGKGKEGRAWLDLSVINTKRSGFSLRDNPKLYEQYERWQFILQHIACRLNCKKQACPHPRMFTKSGLRKKNQWCHADVEMALFTYARGRRRENQGQSPITKRCHGAA